MRNHRFIIDLRNCLLLVAGLWTLCVPSPARAHEDETFLNGLRQRQLFTLAENYCRDELAEKPSARRAADLTEELIRTLAQHAALLEAPQRQPLWLEARRIAAALPASNPRYLLVQTQAALAELARAELGRQEAAVQANDDARERVLEAVREAQRLLEQLNKQLTPEIASRQRRPPANDDELTADELFSLQNHIQYHLATAFRTRARCYPPGADDRIAAIYSALEWCKLPLDKLASDEPLIESIRLEQAACFRLLGNVNETKKLLTPLLDSTNPTIKYGATAEFAKLELAAGKVQETYSVVLPIPFGEAPQIDLIRMDAALFLLDSAKKKQDEAAVKTARSTAVALAKKIRTTHGPYWGRRADQRLISVAGQGSGDLEILNRQADELWQRGELVKAKEAYSVAGAKAAEMKQDQRAFELYYRAALVAGRQKQPAEQLVRLRQVATTFPANPNANKAHYIAIVLAAQQARSDASLMDLYGQLLVEHLAHWPDGPQAGKIFSWRGRLAEQRGQWNEASEAYYEAAQRSERIENVQGFERAALQTLGNLARESPNDAIRPATAMATQLESLVLEQGRLPAAWSPTRRAAALSAARIHLRFVPNSHRRAESLLLGAMNGAPPASQEFLRESQPLLVVALAGQADKLSSAANVLKKLEQSSIDQLLETLDGLSDAVKLLPEASRAGAAKLQLETIDALLKNPDVTADIRQRMERTRAAALAAAGNTAEAAEAYESLASKHRDQGAIQIAYARFLSQLNDPEVAEKALSQWRRVAQRARPSTDLWYEAKYQVALQLFRKGDKQGAAERLEHIRAVYGLDETRWKTSYLRLLRQCK